MTTDAMSGSSANLRRTALAAAVFFTAVPQFAFAEGVPNRTIGYVLVNKAWAVYRAGNSKDQCPNGFNDGPREQFAKLYPDTGKERTLLETQLDREGDVWFPDDSEPRTDKGALPYYEAAGKVAIGMNLDGKVGPNDFTGPFGERGIDNQLYRAIGCVRGLRGGSSEYMQRYIFNRVVIELTDVDDLANDPDVTVTTYRGLDPLLTGADGKTFLPGGTQPIDERWGKRYIHRVKGKIVDGVLTTEPADIKLPDALTFDVNPDQSFKAARFQLKLSPTSAEGLLGAYVDVKSWQHRITVNSATHHASYGQVSIPSVARALWRLADAYPDPKTGKNTAISAAVEMKFVQAYVIHGRSPQTDVAAR